LFAAEHEVFLDWDALFKNIKEFKAIHGYPPTQADCFLLLKRLNEKNIDNSTMAKIVNEVKQQQRPLVSNIDILKIYHTKRNSLHDYIVKYHVRRIPKNIHDGETATISEFDCEFVFKKNKKILDVIRKTSADENSHEKVSYDGEKMISLREFGSAAPQASIDFPDKLGIFFHPWMPLVVSGLFDTRTCFPHSGYDVVMFLEGDILDGNVFIDDSGNEISRVPPNIFEKIEDIDGHQCISVSSYNDTWYFDINRDFSILRCESFDSILSDRNDNAVLIGRRLSTRRTLCDLYDYGNGIWLPSKIISEYFDDKEKLTSEDIVTVSSIRINQGIDDAFFVDFIPKNALVADGIKGMTYRWEDHASIDSLLRDTVKSKRVFIYRYISIISGFALIFLVLAMKYRQYLKNKGERENKTEETK
jgi:hypothetical protein